MNMKKKVDFIKIIWIENFYLRLKKIFLWMGSGVGEDP